LIPSNDLNNGSDTFVKIQHKQQPLTIMSEQQIYRFMVLEGIFRGKERTYERGEIFESPYPLDEMFVNKFQRMSDTVIRDEVLPPKRVKPDTRMTFVFADAEDVTGSYPLAHENNLRVFKDTRGGFAVVADGIPDEDLMNIAPTVMGSKKQVNEWLTSYLQSRIEV
jgi:hypothetical protein